MAAIHQENTTLPEQSTSEQITARLPQHLDPSPLGTKAYWSSLYTTDLSLRQGTVPSHTGTTWFDDADAEGKTVHYLSKLQDGTSKPPNDALSLTNTSFLDLGTGNGSLLCALRKQCWSGEMVGVDYADSSIALAKDIWQNITERGWEDESDSSDDDNEESPAPSTNAVHFHTLDILSLADSSQPLPDWTPASGFDVVLDKGTFDAVSLSSDVDTGTRRHVAEVYAFAASRFLKKPHGRMLVTSCNWTASELETWFCGDAANLDSSSTDRLVLLDKLPYRTFRFGGKEGSVVVGLVFGWKN